MRSQFRLDVQKILDLAFDDDVAMLEGTRIGSDKKKDFEINERIL